MYIYIYTYMYIYIYIYTCVIASTSHHVHLSQRPSVPLCRSVSQTHQAGLERGAEGLGHALGQGDR